MTRWAAFLLLVLTLAAEPARAEWRRAESPNFVVYGEESESRLRERILLLEDFDRLLKALTAGEEPPAENRLHVYIVSGNRELNLVRPLGPNIAGFYTATADGIAAFVDGNVDGDQVLFHEYAHHFLLRHAPSAYPAWYVEGFAEFLMTARFERRHIDIGRAAPGRAYSITEGRWLPMERVLTGDTGGLNREQGAMYYALSWLATHYFFSSPERQTLLWRYIAAFRGDDPKQAFESATGMTMEQFEAELRRYVRSNQITVRRMARAAGEAEPPVRITRLGGAADDLMLYAARLRIGVSEDEGSKLVDDVRAAAARHGDDPFARRVLAHAEARFGDSAAADRLLDALLAAAPEDAELMYLRGLRHLRSARDGDEAQARLARQWFTRAHRADPNHFQTLYRYAESLRRDREYLSNNTRNVLLLAHQLAPQVAEIRINAAGLLIGRREYAYAEALLAPLAADHHDPGTAQAAQRLIERARSAADGAAPAAPAAGAAPEADE